MDLPKAKESATAAPLKTYFERRGWLKGNA
jgi:hypothetical protein